MAMPMRANRTRTGSVFGQSMIVREIRFGQQVNRG
jgi:hypothetical protein